MSDEGYLLLQAVDMLDGKVLYRDMDSFVAPGVWFLLAGLFSLVEPSVIASRMLALGGFVARPAWSTAARSSLAGRGAAAGAVVAMGVFAVWAFPAWTFSFYSPYAVLFALLALERLLAGGFRGVAATCSCVVSASGSRSSSSRTTACWRAPACCSGCWRSTASCGRPLAPALRAALADLARDRCGRGGRRAAVARLASSPWGPSTPPSRAWCCIRSAASSGATTSRTSRSRSSFEKQKMAGCGRLTYGAWAFTHTALRFDWPRPLVRGIEQLHVLLYWLPPAFLVAGAALAFAARDARRRFDAGLLAATAVAGLLFLGVFPRADFNHLLNVLQPSIVIGAVVSARALAQAKRRPRRVRRGDGDRGGGARHLRRGGRLLVRRSARDAERGADAAARQACW